jgi:hypothetical protein
VFQFTLCLSHGRSVREGARKGLFTVIWQEYQ